ncbi:MAG: hypothetical protein R6X05_06875 [Desulfobacterales bacterium]
MSVESEIAALAKLDGKADGQLIRSEDWNQLVKGVINIGQALQVLIQGLDGRVAAVETSTAQNSSDIGNLQTRLTTLESRDASQQETLDALAPLGQQYRITLQTSEASFVLGQVAEITAQVRTLAGEVPSPLPWVDFFCSWGRLRAASGFNARTGVGDRALSVQVDSQGTAQVQVTAEHAAGLSPAEENQVSEALQATIEGTGLSVAETLKQTATPADARVRGAFQVVSREYQRTGSQTMRRWADAYYQHNGFQYGGLVSGRWRDNRATVLAFVKNDIDPRTPDFGRGVSSIQVNFRDWVGNWVFEYLDDLVLEVGKIVEVVGNRVTKDYEVSINGIRDAMAEHFGQKGLIGRQKAMMAAERAMDQMEVVNPPPFLGVLTQTVKQAVNTQMKLDVLEFAGAGVGAGVGAGAALNALVGQAAAVGAVSGKITAADAGVKAISAEVSGIRQSVSTLGLQMETTREVGQALQVSLSDIENKVVAIDPLNRETLQGTLAQINARIGEIKSNLGNF